MGPWRSTLAALPTGTNTLRGSVFPSGRQALSEMLRTAGLGRSDRVAVPEWSGTCVLSAVSVVATPVSMSEVRTPPAAVLVYDQWGWARRPGALEAIADKWPDTIIMRDAVDTADFDLPGDGVWSLFKLLGLSGGGMARFNGRWLPFTPDPEHQRVAEALERCDLRLATEISKTHVRWLFPAFDRAEDLCAAVAQERGRRLANLDAARSSGLAAELPDWMRGEGGPGLCPILRGHRNLDAARKRLDDIGMDVPAYHFDFAGAPLQPSYEMCLALPLHGEITPEIVERVAQALRGI